MDFLKKPWAHQMEGFMRAVPLPEFGFFFEQGTGKSSTTINVLRYKFSQSDRILRTIIFGPPIIVDNWRNEWSVFSKVPKSEVIPLVGPGKKRLQTFMAHAFKETPKVKSAQNKIFITNYESLLMKDLYKAFQDWHPEALVWDECHRLKSYKAQRSKLADELSNPRTNRPFVYCLSGTPVLNSPMDIFQQFVILDGGKTFGRNFFAFRARYFRDRNAAMPKDRYFPKWEVMTKERDGVDGLAELNAKMFQISMRVEKKDCLDLPPEICQMIKVGMSPEQNKLYREMKNDFVTYYKSKACVASLAITKALRLMQIASGFVSLAPGETEVEGPSANFGSLEDLSHLGFDEVSGLRDTIEFKREATNAGKQEIIQLDDTPKLNALKSMLEDLTEHSKVLVWAVWKENYAQLRKICEDLEVDFVEVHGGITAAQKQRNIDRFKTDPKCKVFIGHPGSGGIGINLVVAPYSIFYSRTFSLEHYLQARARNHRGGSEIHEKITHYDLVCEGTIDEAVVAKLAAKQDISDRMLGDLVETE